MRISKQSVLSGKVKDTENLIHYYTQMDNDVLRIIQVLQGRVRFGDGIDGMEGENIAGEFQVVSDTGVANTEFTVSHSLGAVPIGYLVIKIDKAGVVYDSGTTWTSTDIYLKCSASNANVTLFLMK